MKIHDLPLRATNVYRIYNFHTLYRDTDMQELLRNGAVLVPLLEAASWRLALRGVSRSFKLHYDLRVPRDGAPLTRRLYSEEELARARAEAHEAALFHVWRFVPALLERVHTLDLSWQFLIHDASAFGRVHTLDLSHTGVEDVGALSHVHTLNLSHTRVRDVSALSNVHTLNLCATAIEDVSALSHVHTLDLSWTPVRDVSALANVHKLDLSYTRVQDVSALSRVHTLNLSATEVEDVSALANVHTLDISYTKIRDVSALVNVRKLYYTITRVLCLVSPPSSEAIHLVDDAREDEYSAWAFPQAWEGKRDTRDEARPAASASSRRDNAPRHSLPPPRHDSRAHAKAAASASRRYALGGSSAHWSRSGRR
jgi:hypothetical protein